MTYLGAVISSIQYAPIIARVHATASRRDLATASSLSFARNRMTLDEASYSSNVCIKLARNARRFFGGRQDRCARINAPIIVSSTDGSGKSSALEGGSDIRSGILTPHEAAPSRRVVIDSNKTGICKAAITHGEGYPLGEWLTISAVFRSVTRSPSRMGAAVGPADGPPPPAYCRTAPIQQKGGHSDRPLCPLSKAFRQSAELSRGYVGLSHSLALKPHRSGFILNARDLRPVAKLNENHGSQGLVSKSANRRWPAGVPLQ